MRVNISVPDELAADVKRLRIPVSHVCQGALKEAVKEKEMHLVGSPAVLARAISEWLRDQSTDSYEQYERTDDNNALSRATELREAVETIESIFGVDK